MGVAPATSCHLNRSDALVGPDQAAYLATRRAGAAALALTVDTASGTMRQMRVLACFGTVPEDLTAA
jgi:hypothetical protein